MKAAPWFKKTIVFPNSSTDHGFLFKTVFCRSEIPVSKNKVRSSSIYAKRVTKVDLFKARLVQKVALLALPASAIDKNGQLGLFRNSEYRKIKHAKPKAKYGSKAQRGKEGYRFESGTSIGTPDANHQSRKPEP